MFLESELGRLKSEVEAVKASFKAQGLSLEESIQIVGEVKELRTYKANLQDEISKLEGKRRALASEILEMDNYVKSTESYIKGKLTNKLTTLYNAEMKEVELERKVEELQTQACKLQEHIKTLESQKLKLTEEVDELQREKTDYESFIKALKAEKVEIEMKIDKFIEEAEEFVERKTTNAEEERMKILNEIDVLKRERDKLVAEKDFLECAVKDVLKQLQQARESQKTSWPTQAKKGNESPFKSLIERLPTPPPLSTRQTRKTRTISIIGN